VELFNDELENGSEQTGMVVDPKMGIIGNRIGTARATTTNSIGVGDGVIRSR